jgi:chromosome segregation ATPase
MVLLESSRKSSDRSPAEAVEAAYKRAASSLQSASDWLSVAEADLANAEQEKDRAELQEGRLLARLQAEQTREEKLAQAETAKIKALEPKLSELRELESSEQALALRHEAIIKRLHALEQELKNSKEQRVSLETEVASAEARLKSTRKEAADHLKVVAQAEDREERLRAKKGKIEAAEARLSELRELESSEQELAAQHRGAIEKLQELELELQRAREMHASRETEVASAEARLKSTRKEIADLQRQVQQREEQHSKLSKDIASNNVRADARLQAAHAQQNVEDERLRVELAQLDILSTKLQRVHEQLARESDVKYENVLQNIRKREDEQRSAREERVLLEQHVTEEESKLIELRRRCDELQAQARQGQAQLAKETTENESLKRRAEESLKKLQAEHRHAEARVHAEQRNVDDLDRRLADLKEREHVASEQAGILGKKYDETLWLIADEENKLAALEIACSERRQLVQQMETRLARDREASELRMRQTTQDLKKLTSQQQATRRELEALDRQLAELANQEQTTQKVIEQSEAALKALRDREDEWLRADEARQSREKEVAQLAEYVSLQRKTCTELQSLIKSTEERISGGMTETQLRASLAEAAWKQASSERHIEEERVEAEKSRLGKALRLVYGDPTQALPANFERALHRDQNVRSYARDYEFMVEGTAAVWKDISSVMSSVTMPKLVWAEHEWVQQVEWATPVPAVVSHPAATASQPLESSAVAAVQVSESFVRNDQPAQPVLRTQPDIESTARRTLRVERHRLDVESTLRLLREDVISQNDRIKSLMHEVHESEVRA